MAMTLPEEQAKIDQSSEQRYIEGPSATIWKMVSSVYSGVSHATYCVWTQNMVSGD